MSLTRDKIMLRLETEFFLCTNTKITEYFSALIQLLEQMMLSHKFILNAQLLHLIRANGCMPISVIAETNKLPSHTIRQKDHKPNEN
jgi:hypothetical protein